jgi:phosphate transport system substrate-binding protein
MHGQTRRHFCVTFLISTTCPALAEQPVTIQGSTTFALRLMEPYQAMIAQRAGVQLSVIPNKSINGVLAVLEGRADLAMISAPLEAETQILRSSYPALPFDQLQSFEITRATVAFVTHPDNPLKRISLDEIRRILLGQITSWRELGGHDLPIKLVMVREGGGVSLSVQTQLLAGQNISAANTARLETSRQVLKVTAQEHGALGMTQPSLALQAGLPRLDTDGTVEQVLNFVSLGVPTPRVQKIISATRSVAAERLY